MVAALIVLALVLGAMGLLLEGLQWLLILAVIGLLAGLVLGVRGRRTARTGVPPR
jgi:hypothetical protein